MRTMRGHTILLHLPIFRSNMNGVGEEPRMRKPTKVYGSAWIYEEIPEISKICPNPEWNCGNWMMFFDNAMVDQKWEQAVNLYRQGTVLQNLFFLFRKITANQLFS